MSYKSDYATSRRSVKKQQDIRLQDLHRVTFNKKYVQICSTYFWKPSRKLLTHCNFSFNRTGITFSRDLNQIVMGTFKTI